MTPRLAVSPSQLKDWLRCERAWFLKSVARVQDDATAGGFFLVQGELFDEAVQLWSARMPLEAADLVANVRRKPGQRGAALTLPEEKWLELAERAQRMLRNVVAARLLPDPKTARIQHSYRVLVPGFEADGGVVITGKTDLRQPGRVWDTKTTSDRGPGRGPAADVPPNALDATTLPHDVQALTYAWCEFQTDPSLHWCEVRWVYVSKGSTTNPVVWDVRHTFARAEVLAWFETAVRPVLRKMLALKPDDATLAVGGADAGAAAANHEGCGRCFVRFACEPFKGKQEHLMSTTNLLTIAERRAAQAARLAGGAAPPAPPPAPTLEEQLRASLTDAPASVVVPTPPPQPAINRPEAMPRVQPAAAARPVLDVEGYAEFELDAAHAAPALKPEPPPPPPAAPPSAAPKRGRGRPRRSDAPALSPAEAALVVHDATGVLVASVTDAALAKTTFQPYDAETLERLATAAQGVADAADRFVATCNAELRARGVRV